MQRLASVSCVQVVPFCQEEYNAQVAEGRLPRNDTLATTKWGKFPLMKDLKQLHTKTFNVTKNQYSQKQTVKKGPTDKEMLAALKYFLLEKGDSAKAAYMCMLRVAADRSGVSRDRLVMDTKIEVSAVCMEQWPDLCCLGYRVAWRVAAGPRLCCLRYLTAEGVGCRTSTTLSGLIAHMQVLEDYTGPHNRKEMLTMHVRDKGLGDTLRVSVLCDSFDVQWDPLSALGEFNCELWRSTQAIECFIADRQRFMTAVILPSPNGDGSKSLNTRTMGKEAQTSMRHAGRRPLQITTVDGQPAAICIHDNVLHTMRHASSRKVTKHEDIESSTQLMTHRNSQ